MTILQALADECRTLRREADEAYAEEMRWRDIYLEKLKQMDACKAEMRAIGKDLEP